MKNVGKIGYKFLQNSYFKVEKMNLYFIDENTSKNLFSSHMINIFFFQRQLKPIKNTIQETFKSTYKQILKNDFEIFISNK